MELSLHLFWADMMRLWISRYRQLVENAELTFLHQVVFDSREQKRVPLSPYPSTLSQHDLVQQGHDGCWLPVCDAQVPMGVWWVDRLLPGSSR
jgi:hypothetical protein